MIRSRNRKLKRAGGTVSHHSAFRLLPLASAVVAAMPVAFAQDVGLEEIVVTAQKRTESLQDVPVSVLAFDTHKLEELGVEDMDDYLKFLPSVSYQTFGPGFAGVYMRGVASGENRNHSGPLPSVGMYLDEQPITTIQGSLDIHMYDIQRVEALAGPQGTLFGASSQAGTIRVISNKPDATGFEAGYNVSGNMVEYGDEGYMGEGFVNIPVNDDVAIRLVGWYRHDAGYIDNEPGTRTYPTSGITEDNFDRAEDDYNDVDTYGGRGAIKWDVNDRWTVTGTLMGQIQNANGVFGNDESLRELDVSHGLKERSEDEWMQSALTIEGKIASLDLVYTVSYLDRESIVDSDYADYGYWYDVLYGYGAYMYDDDGALINPAQFIKGKDKYNKHSQELRLSSPADWRMRFVTGLYFQRQFHSIEQRYMVDGLTSLFEVTGWPDTIWLTEQDRIDRDYAVFGELSYDLQENLTLTAGLRVFKAKNSLKGFFGYSGNFSSRTGEAACFDQTDFDGAPCVNLDKVVKEYGSTPKISLSYKIDEDKMVYGTISRGYRPGGVNRRGTFPPYTSDYLTNFELGWKTEWLDNTLRVNGAFFYERWEDFQFSFLGQNGLTNITNAGAADMLGVETDFMWVPTDQFTLAGGFSWLDADLTEDFCVSLDANGEPLPEALCPPDDFAPSGTRLPVSATFKSNVTARYQWDLYNLPTFVQGSLIYNGKARAEMLPSDNAVVGSQGDYVTVDFSAGVEYGNASLEVFLDNAFDERYDVNRFIQCTVCGPQPYAIIGQPRTLGIKFGQQF